MVNVLMEKMVNVNLLYDKYINKAKPKSTKY